MGKEQDQKTGGVRLLAITALVSALAASSCCVLPLLFVTVGISGAWIGALTSLAPYQPIFLTVAAAAIAAGFWSVIAAEPRAPGRTAVRPYRSASPRPPCGLGSSS